MKMYVIEKNSPIVAMNVKTLASFQMNTTKRNEFMDTVIDPISYLNGRRCNQIVVGKKNLNSFAKNGNYVFAEGNWIMIVGGFHVKTLA